MWMFVHRQLSCAAATDLTLFFREIYFYCMKLIFVTFGVICLEIFKALRIKTGNTGDERNL